MSIVVDKRVQIADHRAKRLEQLAAACGATEDALIEEGLDLLFRKQEQKAARAEAMQEDQDLLQQMEAEHGPIQPATAPPVLWEDAVFLVGTLTPLEQTRHIEERR